MLRALAGDRHAEPLPFCSPACCSTPAQPSYSAEVPRALPPPGLAGDDLQLMASLVRAHGLHPTSSFPSRSIRQLKERVANLRVKHDQIYNFSLQHIEPQVNWSTVIEEKQVLRGAPVPLPGAFCPSVCLLAPILLPHAAGFPVTARRSREGCCQGLPCLLLQMLEAWLLPCLATPQPPPALVRGVWWFPAALLHHLHLSKPQIQLVLPGWRSTAHASLCIPQHKPAEPVRAQRRSLLSNLWWPRGARL